MEKRVKIELESVERYTLRLRSDFIESKLNRIGLPHAESVATPFRFISNKSEWGRWALNRVPTAGGGGALLYICMLGMCRARDPDFQPFFFQIFAVPETTIFAFIAALGRLTAASPKAFGQRPGGGGTSIIDTGYLNRPNWLLAGYSVYHRVASQPTMFRTGPRSRHQRRCAGVRDATAFYECMMIHSRIESPSVYQYQRTLNQRSIAKLSPPLSLPLTWYMHNESI